jgi:hypothetical protein
MATRKTANDPGGSTTTILVNRAPVLTLWAAVVAERLGYDRDAALTLGRAVAGLNAQAKGRRLGIFEPAPPGAKRPERRVAGETIDVELLGRIVPAVRTKEGVRALGDGRAAAPASVERYLEGKFGDALAVVREAMAALARSLSKDELAAQAFALYERFRPGVPPGQRGWGAKGVLDLGKLKALAGKGRR